MFKKLKRIINITSSSIIKGNGNIVINGKHIKNGNEIIEFGEERQITVIVEGNCKNLEVEVGDIEVKGNVEGDIKVGTGDIDVEGDVGKDIKVGCGDIDIEGSIGGSCKTGIGDIDINNRK